MGKNPQIAKQKARLKVVIPNWRNLLLSASPPTFPTHFSFLTSA